MNERYFNSYVDDGQWTAEIDGVGSSPEYVQGHGDTENQAIENLANNRKLSQKDRDFVRSKLRSF